MLLDRRQPIHLRLGISRGNVYYEPSGVSESDPALVRRLDELHLKHPQQVA